MHAYIPAVRLTDAAVQRCFDAAVHNLVKINTVPCDFSVYNSTGLLSPELPLMIRAGGDYDTPWTRDAAVNTWNAGAMLIPQVSRNTLLAVCVNDADGNPIIQPDNQRWDRVVWILGAWQYYLATGDEEFLEIARGVALRGLEALVKEWYDPSFGLFRGGSFFNDGIAGYPAGVHEPGMCSSFMGDHPMTERIMCLSTNVLYWEAFGVLCRMGVDPDGSVTAFREKLGNTILTRFRTANGGLGYLVWPDGSLDESLELAGVCFAVLFGLADASVLDILHAEPKGIPSIWPPFPGLFSREMPGRHNNLIWPFLNGWYIRCAGMCGDEKGLWKELKAMTDLTESTGLEFYEIYNAVSGEVDGGWQTGETGKAQIWASCRNQTWSATGYICAVIRGVFGVNPEQEGLRLQPCVPQALADSSLEELVLRGKRFHITLRGHGKLVRATVNGKVLAGDLLPWSELEESNTVILEME